ncbi:MAG: protein kinase [Pseudomonadota bacterium]
MGKSDKGFMATSAPDAGFLASAESGEIVGNWRIVNELGTGAMSAVYSAERADGLFTQSAALKLMAPGGSHRRDRFDKERQALALLDHPSIARIIDGGSDAKDRPFLVMELVDGETIDDWAEAEKPSRRAIIEQLCELCGALNHAHARMILHRDIKPSNILIDRKGRLRLVDFGISVSLEDDENEASYAAHTPAFAAPEQLEGEAETSASDIFAIGCVANFLLSGNVPERKNDGSVTISAAGIGDKDLAAILAQATHLDSNLRYQSANALRDDFQAWLDKRPVSARDGGAAYRFERFLRRNPLETALGSLALVSLIGGLVVSLVLADRARDERDQAILAKAETQWSLDRSNYFNQSTSAYADLMQRIFGESDDVERLTALLLERLEEVQAQADKDGDTAAFLSYAVGRHFLFRNDYPNSITAMEHWVQGAYGPEKFHLHGKQLLAIAYRRTGRTEEAIDLERQLERQMTGTFDENTPDHAATASNLALTTFDPADLERAQQVVVATIPGEEDPSITMFLQNQLSKLYEASGDFDRGYEAMKGVVEIIDKDELGEISGQDTGRLNLIAYELFHSEDLERAEELLAFVFRDAEIRGASSELARAQWYRAEIEWRRGDMKAAKSSFETALPLSVQFTGEEAPLTKDIRHAYAELLAGMDEFDAAGAMLDQAGDSESVRHQLASLRLMLEQEGAEAALGAMSADNPILAEKINSAEKNWRYEKLRADGLKLPDLSAR